MWKHFVTAGCFLASVADLGLRQRDGADRCTVVKQILGHERRDAMFGVKLAQQFVGLRVMRVYESRSNDDVVEH